MSTVSVLERRIYAMRDVDTYLGLVRGTARRWIDGYERGGTSYPPVIRPERTGDDTVAWGEFVETGLLAEYRHQGISLQRLRQTIQVLRAELGVSYPLATARPYLDVEGRELVQRIQDQDGVERGLRLVVVRNGQLVLAPRAERFAARAHFEGEGGIVAKLRTSEDTPDVLIDPLRQTGQPVVRSVPTAVLAEGFRAGETVEVLAELYELSVAQVEQAIRFEMRLLNERLAA